jgi:hypothetical protein
MEEKYYIIRNSDGETTVRELTKKELLREIDEERHTEYLSKIPHDIDTNYWGEGVLIIKGTVVQPKPEQVVTKYDID